MEDIKFCKYDITKEKDYVWALCLCSTLTYGHRIKRNKKDRYVTFICPKCKKEITMFVGGKEKYK